MLLLCLAASFCFSQDSDRDVSAISAADRVRIMERLKLLIQYQKSQEWSKQYELLTIKLKRAEGKQDFINRTRQAYTRWGRKPLLDFEPLGVRFLKVGEKDDVLYIVGCSELSDNGKKIHESSLIEAYKERNDWYFSEIHSVGSGREDDPCFASPAAKGPIALLYRN
jgi:hypothetical protein